MKTFTRRFLAALIFLGASLTQTLLALPPDPAPFAAPIILEAYGSDPMTIRVRFVDTNTTETGYFFYYSTSPDGPFEIEDWDFGTTLDSGNVIVFQTNSGYEANTLLYIKVAAFSFDNATGEYSPLGPFSELVSATTLAGWPPSPTDFAATAEGDHIRLTWTDHSEPGHPLDEAAWGLMRSNDGGNYNLAFTVPANTETYVDHDVMPGTQYYYRLESINQFGNSFDVYFTSATTLPFVPKPTAPAAQISFSDVLASSLSVAFVPGNGTHHLAVMKAGSPPAFLPTDSIVYAGDVGNGETVVYAGTDSTFDVSGLLPETAYYITIFTFNTDGVMPRYLVAGAPAASVLTSNTNVQVQFFGLANAGGSAGAGTIFKTDDDGGDLQVLHNFQGAAGGAGPSGGLIQGTDGALYGVTYDGGAAPYINGTIFKVNPDGGMHQVLHTFQRPNGTNPTGALLQGADGALYGMTVWGERTRIFGNGTIFRINTDGTGHTVLHKFDGNTGSNPYGSLIQGSDGWLYGLTSITIFKIRPDGSGFQVMHRFDESADGIDPNGSLVHAPDGWLYGFAQHGGAYGAGSFFRIKTDASDFTVLYNFSAATGAFPQGTPARADDGTFFGLTYEGGASGVGTLFRIAADGTGHTVLHNFNETDGANPIGGSLLLYQQTLFGRTHWGGQYHAGVFFNYNLATAAYTKLADLDYQPQYASLLPLPIDETLDVFVTAPADGATNQPVHLHLTAKEVPGATTYTLQVSTDAAFTHVRERSGGRTLLFDSLAYGTTYYARAKTNLRDGYGRITTFATANKNLFTYVTRPLNNAVQVNNETLNISAKNVEGAMEYTIQLSESPDFTTIAFEASGPTRTLAFGGLKYNTLYYTRARSNLSPDFDEVRSFTTRTAASVAYVVAPANHAENVKTSRNISSRDVPGATQYTIQLSESPDFATIDFELTGPSATLPVSGLKYNTLYYNRVITNLSDVFGEVRSFTTRTAESVTYVTSPQDHATGIQTSPRITSKAVAGATQYTIQLSEQADFAVIAFERTGTTRDLYFSGLMPGTTYYNRVRTNLSETFGPVRSFTTYGTVAARAAAPEEHASEPTSFQARVYPNPFTQTLVVVMESDREAEIKLTDISGRTVHASVAPAKATVEIGKDIPNGVYLLWIRSGGANKLMRVVKIQ